MMYFWALLSTFLEILGDYLFKVGHTYLGSMSYLLGILPWFFMLANIDLSKAIVIFTALNVLGCLLVGKLFLNESMNPQQIIGSIVCLIGLILV